MRISDWSSDVCSSDLRQRVGARRGPRDIRDQTRKPAREAVDPPGIGGAVGGQVKVAVDFDLHRVYPQLRPAVGPYYMPAGIGLVARHRHADPARRGQALLDEPFPPPVAPPAPPPPSAAP